MSRYRKGRELYAATWRVMASDKRLLVWPAVLAVLTMTISTAAFLVAAQVIDFQAHERTAITLGMVIAGYPLAFVTFFCGVALAGTLKETLQGREPDPRAGWVLARRRIGVIAAWSLFVATVGGVLKLLEERLPLGGKIVAYLADLGWSLATLFAVPVLAFEGRGPVTTVRRSASIVRERFAAGIGGAVATAALGWVASIPGVLMIGGGIVAGNTGGAIIAAAGFGWVLLVLSWQTAIDHAFRVILYESVTGELA